MGYLCSAHSCPVGCPAGTMRPAHHGLQPLCKMGRRRVWKCIFDALAEEDEDSAIFIDASIVTASRTAAGVKKGDWRKVSEAHAAARAPQVHTAVDALCSLRPGGAAVHVHDSRMIGLFPDWKKPSLAIVADKACGRAKIRQHIADEAALTVILSNSDVRNPVLPDKTLHAMCDIVERFFAGCKDMRRFATRFEKYRTNCLDMIYLLAIRCSIN